MTEKGYHLLQHMRFGILALMTAGVLLLFPSFRPILKHAPHPSLSVLGYTLCGLLLYMAVFSHKRLYLLLMKRAKVILGLFVLGILLVTIFVYPRADALKEVGRGSTSDDALIVAAQNFYTGKGMYSETLYDTGPISPGPAWVLFNSPLTVTGMYFLLNPVYLIVFLGIFGKKFGAKFSAAAGILLSTSILFWELLAIGHDVVALGCMLAIMPVWLNRIDRAKWLEVMAYTAVLGVFSTSRIVLLPVPFLYGFFLSKRTLPKALFVCAGSLAVALSFHCAFFLVSEFYQPLHLFGRAEHTMGAGLIAAGAVACLAVLGLMVRHVNGQLISWLYWSAALFGTFFLSIGVGQLIASDFAFSTWEGANYFMPAIPLGIVALCAFSALHASISGDEMPSTQNKLRVEQKAQQIPR